MAGSIFHPNRPSEGEGVDQVRSPRPLGSIALGMLRARSVLQAPLSPFATSYQTFADSVKNVTNVTRLGSVVDAYSLQLNTEFFTPSTSFPRCSHACRGWIQFVFQNAPGLGGTAFMQYWLINYGVPCPAGWSSFAVIDCVTNSSNVVSVPFQPIG